MELGHALLPSLYFADYNFFKNPLAENKMFSSNRMIIILLLLCLVYTFLNWEKKSREKNYLRREVVYMVTTFKLLPKEKSVKKKDFKCKISHNFKKLTSIFYHLSCTISQLSK